MYTIFDHSSHFLAFICKDFIITITKYELDFDNLLLVNVCNVFGLIFIPGDIAEIMGLILFHLDRKSNSHYFFAKSRGV